jgi:hypothetical protein
MVDESKEVPKVSPAKLHELVTHEKDITEFPQLDHTQFSPRATKVNARAEEITLNKNLESLSSQLEKVKGYETQAAAQEKNPLGTNLAAETRKRAATEKQSLEESGRKEFKKTNSKAELHNEAITALDAEEKAAIEQLKSDVAKKAKDLQKNNPIKTDADLTKVSDQLEVLNRNQAAAENHITESFKAQRADYTQKIIEAQEHAGNLEKATGVKASEHMSEQALAGAKSVAGKSGEGIISRYMSNLKGGKSKLVMYGGTVAIGALAIDGLRRFGKAVGILSPSKDENGVDQPAGVGIGVVELAGAAGLGILLAKAPKGVGAAR